MRYMVDDMLLFAVFNIRKRNNCPLKPSFDRINVMPLEMLIAEFNIFRKTKDSIYVTLISCACLKL